MSEIVATRPPNENDNLLRKKFYEDIALQSERVDSLSAHLLTIELAIPGIYATVLKLISGDKVALGNTSTVRWTFLLWGIALLLTLAALTPKKWLVDPDILVQDPKRMDEGMGIEDYFMQSAQYKRRLALLSTLFFFAGIMTAAFTIG